MISTIFLCLTTVAAFPDTKQPNIELSKSFDAVLAGEKVSLEYELKNDSPGPIRVLDYKVSCGCVGVERPSGEIASGQTGRIICSMETGDQRGRIVHWVNLKTDHPTKPLVRLEIRGVIKTIWVEPTVIDFGTITGQAPPLRELIVLNAAIPDARITSIEVADPSMVKAEVRPVSLGKKGEELNVESLGQIDLTWTGAQKSPGPYRTELLIHTNLAGKPPIRVPVSAHVAGVSNLSPTKLLFGSMRAGSTVVRSFTVKLEDITVDELRSLTLKGDHKFMHASIDTSKDQAGLIRVKVIADCSSSSVEQLEHGVFRGQMSARLDGRLVFSIPYMAFFDSGTKGSELGTVSRAGERD
jgi:hypothetical protein